jgi:hypothetical protein
MAPVCHRNPAEQTGEIDPLPIFNLIEEEDRSPISEQDPLCIHRYGIVQRILRTRDPR